MSALSTTPRRLFVLGLLVTLVIAGVLSYYASTSPDGLEKVAADKGFDRAERDHELRGSPLGDYGVEGIDDPRLAGGVAGVTGVLLTLAVGGALFWAVRRRDTHTGSDAGHPVGTTTAETTTTETTTTGISTADRTVTVTRGASTSDGAATGGTSTTDRATTGGASATAAVSTEEG